MGTPLTACTTYAYRVRALTGTPQGVCSGVESARLEAFLESQVEMGYECTSDR